jgi:hypothetical protein
MDPTSSKLVTKDSPPIVPLARALGLDLKRNDPAPHLVITLDPTRPMGTLASQPAPVAQPEAAPEVKESPMSFLSTLETAGTKIGTFLNDIVNGAKSIQKIYGALSGPVIAASMAVFYDVVKTVAAAQAAAASASTGNIPVAITLSETTIGLVKTVVADFLSGEKTVVADFEALNIKL